MVPLPRCLHVDSTYACFVFVVCFECCDGYLVDVVKCPLDELKFLCRAERGADVLQCLYSFTVTHFFQVRQPLSLVCQHTLVQQPESSARTKQKMLSGGTTVKADLGHTLISIWIQTRVLVSVGAARPVNDNNDNSWMTHVCESLRRYPRARPNRENKEMNRNTYWSMPSEDMSPMSDCLFQWLTRFQ